MEVFEKAKLALKEYLLANKSKVRADLEQMRNKSVGNDIYNYVENLSKSFSFESVTSYNELTISYDIFNSFTPQYISNDFYNSIINII